MDFRCCLLFFGMIINDCQLVLSMIVTIELLLFDCSMWHSVTESTCMQHVQSHSELWFCAVSLAFLEHKKQMFWHMPCDKVTDSWSWTKTGSHILEVHLFPFVDKGEKNNLQKQFDVSDVQMTRGIFHEKQKNDTHVFFKKFRTCFCQRQGLT